jgi:hypothetical protein
MSVIVTMKVQGDTAQFRRVLEGETERIQGLSARSRAEGCIHHRFGVGDGFVVVVDEWETAEAFQRFISSPELQQIIVEMGAQGEPEIVFSEAIESPDQF